MSKDILPTQPIFFQPNRVWRCYTGGYLLDEFTGSPAPADGHLPEDWLGSTVCTLNGDRSQGPTEGLSRVSLPNGESDPLFRDILDENPREFLGPNSGSGELSILCKYLDASVRLPIQCHPDRLLARELYHSEHGKTESWAVLDSRTIDGVEPYLLMGFKPGISAEAFARTVDEQDIPAMESLMHRVPARAGDVWLIPGRFPHAIGPGVFLLEVQEPSDWVVLTESMVADTPLSYAEMYGQLSKEDALRCFAYEGDTPESLRSRYLMSPKPVLSMDGGDVDRIIGPKQTDCFVLDRITVCSALTLSLESPYHIGVVISGEGTMEMNGVLTNVRRGQVFFIPHGVREISYKASGGPLVMYACEPGA